MAEILTCQNLSRKKGCVGPKERPCSHLKITVTRDWITAHGDPFRQTSEILLKDLPSYISDNRFSIEVTCSLNRDQQRELPLRAVGLNI